MTTEGPNTWGTPGAQAPQTPPPNYGQPPGYGPPPDYGPPPGYGPPAGYGAPPAYGHPLAGQGGRRLGKIRNPWGVWGLSIITGGIYFLYWWYKINEEVRDFDPSIEVEPVLSLLAMFVPIANIVSLVKTGGRIAQAERNAGNSSPCSGGLGLLLALVFSMHLVYYQGHLNKLWEQHGGQPSA